MAKKQSVSTRIMLPLANRTTLILLATLLTVLTAVLLFVLLFFNRIYPGIYINDTHVGGLTPEQATSRLLSIQENRLKQPLTFFYKETAFPIDLSKDHYGVQQKVLQEAFFFGRNSFYKPPLRLYGQTTLGSQTKKQLSTLATSIDEPTIEAQLKVEGEGITVTPSQEGLALDQQLLSQWIVSYIQTGRVPPKELPTKTVKPRLSYESALKIKKALDSVKTTPLSVKAIDQTFIIDQATLLKLLNLEESHSTLVQAAIGESTFSVTSFSTNNSTVEEQNLSLDKQKLNSYIQDIADKVERPVQEPLLSFDPTANPGQKKITEFKPPQDGLELNKAAAALAIQQALANHQSSLVLAVEKIHPKNKLSNELGIKELIGTGVSRFEGSIPNRIYNVELTVKKLNGALIPPGEEFSFVNTVGDISAATGYKPAYVIKEGRTVLDDGGGVCQVSTTLFRAALNAGVPITARTAHAYRVHYYEEDSPPGIDATIFHPSVDFKFKNDTPGHILIQAYTDGLTLYIRLYGTSDGRIASISTPIIRSQTPPPPELRQDDPTLPKGEIKQVDWAAWGANIVFGRTVVRNGQTLIDEKFYSNYKPWQAVYLVGTKEG
jgi:vancomycin resistance protein YoaR